MTISGNPKLHLFFCKFWLRVPVEGFFAHFVDNCQNVSNDAVNNKNTTRKAVLCLMNGKTNTDYHANVDGRNFTRPRRRATVNQWLLR